MGCVQQRLTHSTASSSIPERSRLFANLACAGVAVGGAVPLTDVVDTWVKCSRQGGAAILLLERHLEASGLVEGV